MSETPFDDPGFEEVDESEDPANPLHFSLIKFTAAIAEAVPDICTYGLTMGDSYVPFRPDPDDECEEDEEFCSQVWVRVTQVVPKGDNNAESWDDSGTCSDVLEIELEVGVLRCFQIPEGGEAPTATEVAEAALQSLSDMTAIRCAALNAEVWNSILVGSWAPLGPLGGQYGGSWTFTVEKSI